MLYLSYNCLTGMYILLEIIKKIWQIAVVEKEMKQNEEKSFINRGTCF